LQNLGVKSEHNIDAGVKQVGWKDVIWIDLKRNSDGWRVVNSAVERGVG
jgi:hypothetical protein